MFYKPTGIFGKANNHLAVKYQENKRGCPFEFVCLKNEPREK
jgi:hypothetical protein